MLWAILERLWKEYQKVDYRIQHPIKAKVIERPNTICSSNVKHSANSSISCVNIVRINKKSMASVTQTLTNPQDTNVVSDNEISDPSSSIALTETLTSQSEGSQSVPPDSIANPNMEDDLWGVDIASLFREQTASEATNADDNSVHDEPNSAVSDHDTLSTTFTSPFHQARSPPAAQDISEDKRDVEQYINLNPPESVQLTQRETNTAMAGPTLDNSTTHLETLVENASRAAGIIPFGILPARSSEPLTHLSIFGLAARLLLARQRDRNSEWCRYWTVRSGSESNTYRPIFYGQEIPGQVFINDFLRIRINCFG